MKEKITQTVGRAQLGDFAPMFALLNDDVLFGEVWNEGSTDTKTKCIITVVALMSSGITDSSLTYHLQNAKAHGVTKEKKSPTRECMSAGRRRGRCSALQKRCGMMKLPLVTEKKHIRTVSSSR